MILVAPYGAPVTPLPENALAPSHECQTQGPASINQSYDPETDTVLLSGLGSKESILVLYPLKGNILSTDPE